MNNKENFMHELYSLDSDVEFCYSYFANNDKDDVRFSKWIKFKSLLELDLHHKIVYFDENNNNEQVRLNETKRSFIDKISHRSVLDVELLIDIDEPFPLSNNKEKFEEICKRLKDHKISFKGYTTGSKGYHISVLIPSLRYEFPVKDDLVVFRKKILELIGADVAKGNSRCMIAFEGVPHWKSGVPKSLIDNMNFLEKDKTEQNTISKIRDFANNFNKLLKLAPTTPKQDFEKIKLLCTTDLTGKFKDLASCSERIKDYIVDKYTFKVIFENGKPEIWYYDDGIYKSNGEKIIMFETSLLTEEYFDKNIYSKVIDKIIARNMINSEDFFDDQWKYKSHLIPLNNGVLNINSWQLQENSENNYFTSKTEIDYVEDSSCPKFLKFVNEILLKEDIPIVQELFGYCFLKNYKFHKVFFFTGKGRNGKSILLTILKNLLGTRNVTSLKPLDLQTKDFVKSNLYGKLANIVPDIPSSPLEEFNEIRTLSGGDELTANRKYLSPINFESYAKLIFSANKLPIIISDEESDWLRIVKLDFRNQYLPKIDYEQRLKDDPDCKNVFLQNANLLDELLTESELQGILLWSLEGLKRLLANKTFSMSQSSKEVERSYKNATNSFKAFAEDCIETSFGGNFIAKDVLQEQYYLYCVKNKIKAVDKKTITKTMDQVFFSTAKQIRFNDERPFCWPNVRFKDSTGIVNFCDDKYSDGTLTQPEVLDSEEHVQD